MEKSKATEAGKIKAILDRLEESANRYHAAHPDEARRSGSAQTMQQAVAEIAYLRTLELLTELESV